MLLPALFGMGVRKNFKLGTELNLAGVKFTPPKAFKVGEAELGVVVVVVVVVVVAVDLKFGGERSFLVGFFAATRGFDEDDDDDGTLET